MFSRFFFWTCLAQQITERYPGYILRNVKRSLDIFKTPCNLCIWSMLFEMYYFIEMYCLNILFFGYEEDKEINDKEQLEIRQK